MLLSWLFNLEASIIYMVGFLALLMFVVVVGSKPCNWKHWGLESCAWNKG